MHSLCPAVHVLPQALIWYPTSLPQLLFAHCHQKLSVTLLQNVKSTCKMSRVMQLVELCSFLTYQERKKWKAGVRPQVPVAAPSQMAAGKYRSYRGKVSLFTLLLAAYSSCVSMRGTGCIFQEPDSTAVGVFPQNPSNFPFDTLRLEGPGISILRG